MPDSQNSPTEIGVITGLTGEAYAESDSGSRVLEPGSPIFQGEHLVTGPEGNIEVKFIDDTLLSQGGNSRITLDDYVYDTSDTSASELLLDITEGTFRVVTGKIAEQNPERFKVGSPLATIGIRGTITVHEVQPGGIEKHGVEEIHSGKALIVQSNIDGTIRQIASPLGMVDISPSGELGPVRPLSPQEFNTFREIAPANIREEQEIIQERQEEGEEDAPEDGQDDAPQEGEGEALPGDVAPGDGEPTDGGDGLQGQGIMPEPVGEPPVGPPVEQGLGEGRSGPEFREPPREDVQQDEIDILVEPKPEPEKITTGKTSNGDGNTDTDNAITGDGDGDGDTATYNTITGTSGADNRTGTSGADKMLGLGGDDELKGMDGDDSLSGGDGADTLNGGKGDDILDGGTSAIDIDFASYKDAGGSVTVNLANNTATGADGNDVLNNIEGIIGSNYGDDLTGDDNDNWFEGLNGNDNIYGEGGYDGVSYENAEGAVTVHLGAGTASGAAGEDYLESIENAIGSTSADTITGSSGNNTIHGGKGNDIIDGLGGTDHIYGEGGNDILVGDDGANTIDGGSGFDTVSYIHSTNAVTIDVDAKTAEHCGGTDKISNIESFIGSDHNDSMTGGSGNEQFFGGKGDNAIDGGDGIDTISFASSTTGVVFTVNNVGPLTTITHSDGNDTISNIEGFIGSSKATVSDNMTGSDHVAETFFGTLGDDTIDGKGIGVSGGVDTLSYALIEGKMDISMDDGAASATTGTAFTDTFSNIEKIIGSSYDDNIQGKTNFSAETIQGGQGADNITLGNASTTLSYTSLSDGGDTIFNFDATTDDFNFSGNAFDPAAKTAIFMTINSEYTGSDGLFGGDSEAHFIYSTFDNTLWYDSNGDESGENTLIATINSGDDVTLADITF